MIEAGRLTNRVTFEKRTTTKDDFGHELNTWTTMLTVWANIKPVGARERLRGGQYETTLTHTVVVRYASAYPEPAQIDSWRIKYGDRLFNISGMLNHEEDNTYLVFDCTEGSADGQ